MKNTKKSLIASGISLAVSMALLVGSTFAWFTDSVVNKGNTIQAGNLEVGFEYRDLKDTLASDYIAVPEKSDDTGALFTKDQLWEPGYSFGYDFRVSNSGTLAFDWTLTFENIKSTDGVPDDNIAAKIADVIDVYVVPADKNDLTGETPAGTLSELSEIKGGTLVKDAASEEFSVILKMQKEAGNEYQNGSVTFDVYLRAKQATVEQDGFGSSDYDEAAEYDSTVISATADNFGTVLANAEAGAEVRLTENTDNFKITLTDPQITVDLGGNTVTGQIILEQYKKDCTVTLKNGTLVSDGDYSPLIISDYAEGGSLEVVLNNMIISNPQSGGNVGGSYLYALDSFGIHSVTLNNCTVTGSLNFTDAGSVTIEGGTYTAVKGNDDIALFYPNNSSVTVNNAVLNLSGLELCYPEDWQPTLNKTQIIN